MDQAELIGDQLASAVGLSVCAKRPPVATPILVHCPRGLRIEELDIAALAELVRRVGA